MPFREYCDQDVTFNTLKCVSSKYNLVRVAMENLFEEVARKWDLERLYTDLAKVEGGELTITKKTLLCALLYGYSPAEIAKHWYQSSNSNSVRVTLSRDLYKPLRALMAQKLDVIPTMAWGKVSRLLAEAGYERLQV